MKVLIIEDSNPVATVLKSFVEPLAADVIVTADLRTALDVIEKAGEIEIITLDLTLPDSPARQTLSAIPMIRRQQPNSLLIIVTGAELSTIEKEAMEAGADECVMKQGKTFTPQGFIEMLRAVTHRCIAKPRPFASSVSALENISRQLMSLGYA